MTTETKTVAEVLDGLLLGPSDFDGDNPQEDVSEDQIINLCMSIATEEGAKIEGRGRGCGNSTFHVGGADLFSYSEDENDDGEPCLLIELVETD